MATVSYLVLAVTGMAQIRFNDARQWIDGRAPQFPLIMAKFFGRTIDVNQDPLLAHPA
ncbi:MAG TPA: hypothetical protein PLK44_07270 [Aestuariivirga sp.]|jgi:hypothetical protein|nr:hypothetical protein [Hyphomicrobiales bacterium]HQY73496.1 hypothetical protein [Aestuariivirga sp.]